MASFCFCVVFCFAFGHVRNFLFLCPSLALFVYPPPAPCGSPEYQRAVQVVICISRVQYSWWILLIIVSGRTRCFLQCARVSYCHGSTTHVRVIVLTVTDCFRTCWFLRVRTAKCFEVAGYAIIQSYRAVWECSSVVSGVYFEASTVVGCRVLYLRSGVIAYTLRLQ